MRGGETAEGSALKDKRETVHGGALSSMRKMVSELV